MQGNQTQTVAVGGNPVVLLLGPDRKAVSGVSTHLNVLFRSPLGADYALRHFQVGSEGRRERPPSRLIRLLISPVALAARILREGVALVHINTSMNKAFWRDLAYLLVAKACGVRVVYQVHGGALPDHFSARHRLPPFLLRAILKIPDAVVVLTNAELAAYQNFVRDRLVVVLPNAIDCAPFTRPEGGDDEAGGPLRLVYLGRLVREKGLGETLEGLAVALARGVDARLTVAGAGPDADAFESKTRALGLEAAVRFVGPVSGRAKSRLLGESDVFLLPTYALEGLPYALLESMAAGVPPITTRIGGIPDVVREGEHGIFVPPRDASAVAHAIERLAGDRDLLRRMRRACASRILTGYSLNSLAERFGQLYGEICAEPGGRL